MHTLRSLDGTTIAYDRVGSGPPVILVDGALCHRASGPNGPLANVLASDFTVFTYDRRGRNDSGDIAPYAIEREIEDLEALLGEAGGTAHVYGISSGAALALEAAKQGAAIKKLAIFEAPFVVDDTRPAIPADWATRLGELVESDRRGAAVRYFMRKGVDLPAVIVVMMMFMPAWSSLKEVAHTLPYDAALVAPYGHGMPFSHTQWVSTTQPTLVLSGEKSPKWIQNAMVALAAALPNAKHAVLARQTHMVNPHAIGPVLTQFFL